MHTKRYEGMLLPDFRSDTEISHGFVMSPGPFRLGVGWQYFKMRANSFTQAVPKIIESAPAEFARTQEPNRALRRL